MKRSLCAAFLGWLVFCAVPASPQPAGLSPDAGIAALLDKLSNVAASGRPDGYLKLLSSAADRTAATRFAEETFGSRVDRAVVRERDRQPLSSPGGGAEGYRLVVAALLQTANRGRLLTCEIDITRNASATPSQPSGDWSIVSARPLSSLDNIYLLTLDANRQFAAHDLVVKAEDFELHLPRGSVFVATAGGKPTALVLIGKGEMVFSPSQASERGQVRVLSGADTLGTKFDACLVRVNPADLGDHIASALVQEPVNAGDLNRARDVFAQDIARSYTLDVGNLGPGPWSMLPDRGDFLADVYTRRFGVLTYARTVSEPEDITLFDRVHRHTIALYPSAQKLRSRGRFFNEDDGGDYSVTRYEVDASFVPERQWIEGRTRLLLRVRAPSVQTLRIRLADALKVRSVVADPFGRVMAVRVHGQDTLLVTLPSMLIRGAQLALTIAYAGQLPPLPTAQGTASTTSQFPGAGPGRMAIEPSFLYTVPVAWYAQAPTTAYAPAILRLTVPAPYDCVATGSLATTSEVVTAGPEARPAKSYTFNAVQPVPYLACLISRLVPVASEKVSSGEPVAVGTSGSAEGSSSPAVLLTVKSNPEERAKAAVVARQAQDIIRFYTSLVGTAPYPNLALTLLQGAVPSGNSPAYLAVLNEQVATSPLVWRDDPAGFPDFPEFFTAHELAHQWWGDAVGAENYHEQWLSEAFAQYFAALYAEHAHGHEVFANMMKRMQEWAVRESDQGPVYLGGRVGQLKSDGRAFRAVVYDKGAVVLHMLRRLVGDRAFFNGLRRFYQASRFRKTGSDELRQALEAESGVKLSRFFDRWVYGDTLPRLKFAWSTANAPSGQQLVLRFEQAGDVFDLPITVTVDYADRAAQDLIVRVTDGRVEQRVPITGHVRNVVVNRDRLVPAQIAGG